MTACFAFASSAPREPPRSDVGGRFWGRRASLPFSGGEVAALVVNAAHNLTLLWATFRYVSFNVYYGERASWLVVMNYRGELAQVAPADSVAAEGAAHFCGLKNRDEDTLLLARETNYSGSGGIYLWDWRDDRYTRLGGHGTTGDDDGATTTADVFSAHDAQWSSAHGNAFWAPEAGSAAYSSGNSSQASTGDHVLLVEADTGEVLRKFWAEGGSEGDINHAQFVENDTAAVVSLRLFDGIAKYNVTGGANGGTLRWIVGGKFGHWPIYGIEGHRGKRHKCVRRAGRVRGRSAAPRNRRVPSWRNHIPTCQAAVASQSSRPFLA